MDDYSTEPRLIFTELSANKHCEFYELEMADYEEDINYYNELIATTSSILELGCGEGRVCRGLERRGHSLTGIDLSTGMISLAKKKSTKNICFIKADMTILDLKNNFDVILIPLNTLNLLGSKEKIIQTLSRCHKFLSPGGMLSVELFTPDNTLVNQQKGEKTFQFRIFENYRGGRLIKETLKEFNHSSKVLFFEERYRSRPAKDQGKFEDFKYCYTLYTPPATEWYTLFRHCGFSSMETSGRYDHTPYIPGESTKLLINAQK